MDALEQIALRLAPRKNGTLESDKYGFVNDAALIAYVRKVVAELGAQEPVAVRITTINNSFINQNDHEVEWLDFGIDKFIANKPRCLEIIKSEWLYIHPQPTY